MTRSLKKAKTIEPLIRLMVRPERDVSSHGSVEMTVFCPDNGAAFTMYLSNRDRTGSEEHGKVETRIEWSTLEHRLTEHRSTDPLVVEFKNGHDTSRFQLRRIRNGSIFGHPRDEPLLG